MIKTLRRKFVTIIMVLVGTVLIAVLSGSYASTWTTQHELVEDSLSHGLERGVRELPRWNKLSDTSNDGNEAPSARMSMLVLSVDLDANGIVLDTNEAPVIIDSSALETILQQVLKSDEDMQWDYTDHIAWKRAQRSDGSWRVVIADTSSVDEFLQSQAIRDVAITVLAFIALMAIAIGLSTWILKPVEHAWDSQRQFIADASHELKTPLAVIIANSQILVRDEGIPQESKRWIDSIADESQHMKHLVEELLELARTDETITGAQGVMKQEPVDFSAIVENAALEFDAIAYEHGNEIQEDIEDGIQVTGDHEWLERLCKILVDNACKYSYVGEPITVSLKKEPRRCVLSVNNHGNVIDEEDLPHVFDRFYRTDKARSRDAQTGGFGLGLAIARGICVSHGGDMGVTSTEADGTTFTATLPLQ